MERPPLPVLAAIVLAVASAALDLIDLAIDPSADRPIIRWLLYDVLLIGSSISVWRRSKSAHWGLGMAFVLCVTRLVSAHTIPAYAAVAAAAAGCVLVLLPAMRRWIDGPTARAETSQA